MNPMLRIYHNTSTDYGPSTELSLEDKIRQLEWMSQHDPKVKNSWPFNKMYAPEAMQFQQMAQDEAFQNPIPKHIGEPQYIGPYQVGYMNIAPEWKDEGYGTDGSYTDSLAYSAKKGLLSEDVAEHMTNTLLDDPSEDYLSLVQAGDLTLEEAIKLLGRIPHRFSGLLGE